MKILVNITTEKKDLVKANNAVLGFKDVIGEPIKMVGVVIYEKDEPNEKDGTIETKVVSCLKRQDGEFVTSISPTVRNSIEMIASTYTAEEIAEGVEVIVKSKKSNGGRDFLYLDLI